MKPTLPGPAKIIKTSLKDLNSIISTKKIRMIIDDGVQKPAPSSTTIKAALDRPVLKNLKCATIAKSRVSFDQLRPIAKSVDVLPAFIQHIAVAPAQTP